jgi:hypothetical protein
MGSKQTIFCNYIDREPPNLKVACNSVRRRGESERVKSEEAVPSEGHPLGGFLCARFFCGKEMGYEKNISKRFFFGRI